MKIKDLKQKFGAKTSEELFGIVEQPEKSCSKINNAIKKWYRFERDTEHRFMRLDDLILYYIRPAKETMKLIQTSIKELNIIGEYEELRSQSKKIREWEQFWKDIAIKLIEEKDDVTDILNEKFFKEN